MHIRNPSMEDLSVEIMVEILSRLPVKTIIHCKCVCKKWLDLVSDSYFANLHLSRSIAGLMIHQNLMRIQRTGRYQPGKLKWVEVEDELDHHHLHHDPLMSLDLNLTPIFQESCTLLVGSVDGLLYLWKLCKDLSYICNPITREYMILPLPRKQHDRSVAAIVIQCFGVGSMTKVYKVIRILQQFTAHLLFEAEVYTLGTGQWRSLGHVPYYLGGDLYGPFLNGHAHWPVCGKDSPQKIYAFDFDNETFTLFPSPPVETIQGIRKHYRSLSVLKGCLCQSNTINYSELTLWVMKEYGIKKSWHKELVINESISRNLDWLRWSPLYLIQHLRDGTILMVCFAKKMFAYSCERGTTADIDYIDHCFTAMTYRPSFLRLRNFESERVNVF